MADEAGTEKAPQTGPDGEKGAATEPASGAAKTAKTEGAADVKPASPDAAKTTKAEGAADAKPAAPDASKSKKVPTEQPSEAEINSPDWKTLIPLFAIFAVTVSSWGAARFACNMHPPESKPPPKLSTDKLAQNPKDAAIEFIQRARSNDWEGAAELALRDAKTNVDAERAQCQKTAAECARKREAMAGLLTTAVLTRQDGFSADAVATTYFKNEKKTFKVQLARDTAMWKVVGYSAE